MQPKHLAAWIFYNKNCAVMDYFLIIAFSESVQTKDKQILGGLALFC